MGCQKGGDLRQKDCVIYAQTYAGSIKNSIVKVFSWTDIKEKHEAIVSHINPQLTTKQRQIITDAILADLMFFADLKCGEKPEKGTVIKETSHEGGLLKQTRLLIHPYYECTIKIWKERARGAFLKSCQ